MKFLDTNLAKDLSLLLHAIRSPFYRRIFKKTTLFSGLKNPYKKICELRKLESIHESLRRLELIPRNLDKKSCSRIPSLTLCSMESGWSS
jgi:hypothetical protein